MPNSTHLSALTNLSKQDSLFTGGPYLRLPWWLNDKESAYQCKRHRDSVSMPGSERSSGEGSGSPLQYSCLEDAMDKEPGGLYSPWVTKSWTQLSD